MEKNLRLSHGGLHLTALHQNPPVKLRSLYSLISVGGIVAILLFLFGRLGVSLTDLIRLLPLNAHLGAMAAAGLVMCGRSLRSCILARAIGEQLDFRTALHSQVAGDAVAILTPARVGAEAGKLLVLQQRGVPVSSGAAIHVGELLWEAFGVGILVLLLVLALPGRDGFPALGALAYVGGVAGAALVSCLVATSPGERPPGVLVRLGIQDERWGRLRGAARRFLEQLGRLRRVGPRVMFTLGLLTLVTIVARLAILPFLLGVLPEDDGAGLVVWPLLLLYGGALLPLPGGGGVVELGYLAAFQGALSPALLAASLLWWRIYSHYLFALLGGIVLTAALLSSTFSRNGFRAPLPPPHP